ncbi:hypothetical protein SCATT_10000 [Streptantibioticus cattleyicolor NRRL 8057 = DSM 46488]|uniref:Integral membrane protein n=1 Tax=Streptantibioticus cattleyicolor (strain ATCC 35852 / DSM 46488 / JCM 4925 / NBRC 14057 / NRRL 8057) TaxID=1003195 RepID=G8WN89_STREN|nr:hypothetical protein SCATT_10000 [Streptantibioticus cattleyicolor NRRL 8057 = DSM 46488]
MLAAVAAVGWAFAAMAAVAALGLHLLGADTRGALGPMTAAVVIMAVGGQVSPSGDVTVFGIGGAQAVGAVDIMPLGVALAGALPLGWVFARSTRRAGVVAGGAEFAVRTVAVIVVFLAVLAGLTWAGHETITISGASPGSAAPGLGDLGDLGDLGGLGGRLADSLGRLAHERASVGFRVDAGASVGAGLLWVLAVLALALLVNRRAPLPAAWHVVHRAVRPAASALCTALLLAVAAGFVVALCHAVADDHPGRVVGAALVGTPNAVWLAATLGLFVPWHGRAYGPLAYVLPHPLDQLLKGGADHPVTVAGLAGYDGWVWLLPVAAVVTMLLAGVVLAARTPPGASTAACALRLAVAAALAFALLTALTTLSVNADLSLFGFDALGSGIDLAGSVPLAFLLGAGWGLVCGAVGAALATATGARGTRVAGPAGLSGRP